MDKFAKNHYLPQLDGLRLVAFLLVFIHHFPSGPPNALWQAVHEYGWLGVDLFFAISAFLITFLLYEEQKTTGRLHIRQFYIRRLLRIAPLYYAYLLFISLLMGSVLFSDNTLRQRLTGLLAFTDNGFGAVGGYSTIPYTDHLWTQSYEMQFYLLVPFIYYALAGIRMRWRIILSLAVMLISLWLRHEAIAAGYSHPAIYMLPILRPESLLAGLLLGFAFQETNIFTKSGRIIMHIATVVAMGCLLGMITQQQTIRIYGVWQYYLYAVVAAIAICALYAALKPGSITGALLRARPLSYLGKISYGLYVYHFICINYTPAFLARLGMEHTGWGGHFLFALALTITVATLSYYILERPILKIKERYSFVLSKRA